ncbi:hypothetical protein Tco_1428242 [Tanacetum coccineum]
MITTCGNIVLNGNSKKRTGRDPKGNIMILPPISVEEQIAVQREIKARTILLQSLPGDHLVFSHFKMMQGIFGWLSSLIWSDPQQSESIMKILIKFGKYGFGGLDIKCANGNALYLDYRFNKKAGRKLKFNKQGMLQGKQLDSKARYSSFKLKELDKTEEQRLVYMDDCLVLRRMLLIMIERREDAADNAADVLLMMFLMLLLNLPSWVSLLRLNSEKLDYKAKLKESKARFDKWKDSSKNLDKLIHSSMSSRSKFGLGFGETFGSDELELHNKPMWNNVTHIPLFVPKAASVPALAFTAPRPTTTTASTLENEQGHSSDPNPASSSRPPAYEPAQFTSTHVEDDTMGGSFDISPPRTTQAPPEVDTQASDIKAHKLMFKEVVGKLVKKVKVLEDKIKGRKRKFVLTDSDKEEDAELDMDPLIKLAQAAATAAADSTFAGGSDVPADATPGPSADPFNKGKSPLMEEDPPVKERSFRQREEDRLGEEATKRLYEEEKAELEREREEMQRKRQQDVLNLAKYYTDSYWNDIMGQVHANQGLTADLLGPDVTDDNFAERMVALIAKRRREFAAQRFQDKLNKHMTFAQQKAYMRTFVKKSKAPPIYYHRTGP